MSGGLVAELGALARDRGAAGFGIAGVAPFREEGIELERSRRSGRSGPLRFTYDEPDIASDVTRSFPWARSIIVVGWSYLPNGPVPASTGAVVGRFAGANHYEGLARITTALVDRLRAEGYRAEPLIDDNRLVDRAAAIRAGVGWRGRSTMTLIPGVGPWALLGSVVTDASLPPDRPMRRTCGTCTACMPACPTGAIDDQGLDARRCLSTWLQTPGSIPHWIRPRLGRRVYGCDDCLLACPPGDPALARSRGEEHTLSFPDLLGLDDESLLRRFDWWYVPRRDGRYLRRNLLVAAGNAGEVEAREAILAHLSHPSSMIRGHAAWAVGRSMGAEATGPLLAALERERAPEAREEILLTLLMVEHPDRHHVVLGADESARGLSSIRGLGLVGRPGEAIAEFELIAVCLGQEPVLASPGLRQVAPAGLESLAEGVEWMVRVYDPDRLLEDLGREVRRRTRSQLDPVSPVSSSSSDSSATGVTVTSPA